MRWLGIFEKTVLGTSEGIKKFLMDAGLSGAEVSAWPGHGPEQRTGELLSRYRPELSGRPLASLLRAVHRLGEPELLVDFFIEVIKGPPVAGQLMVLRLCENPEYKDMPKLAETIKTYQADFQSPVEAFTFYQDRYLRGCEKRSCLPL